MFARQYHNEIINDFSRALQHVITVLSLVVNSMLLRIVLTSSHRREIGAYRYLIATCAVSDLVYTCVHWLVYPIPEMYGNAFILGGHGFFNSRIWASIYCGFYAQGSSILVFHFLYRTLNIRRLCVMYFVFSPDEETLVKLAPFFSGNTSSPVVHTIETAANHIQALYWSDGTLSRPRWHCLIGAFDAMMVIAVVYVVILYCSYLINKYLKEHAASTKTMSLHRQLFRSLILQAVYPLFTTYFPMAVSILFPVVGWHFDWVSVFCPPMCVSHPLFDAFALIFCMSEYRSMFLRYIGMSRFLRKPLQVTQSNTPVPGKISQASIRDY